MRNQFVISVILLFSLVSSIQGITQNVGIGTTTPQARLDVVNSFRAGGATTYFSYDSSGRIIWSNSFIYAPSAQTLIRNAKTSVQYNNQQLEYRDSANIPVFYSNWNTGNAFIKGKLGVGVATAEAPLHLSPQIQEKLILYGNSLANNYGIGVESYQLRLHGDGAGNMVFGAGNADNFYEAMRIEPSGAVGIGSGNQTLEATLHVSKTEGQAIGAIFGTDYPSYFGIYNTNDTYLRGGKNNANLILNDIPGGLVGIGVDPTITDGILDVNGMMRIRRGTGSAGIWLNKTNNSGVAGFVGMEDDNHIGFYGNVSGWKFSLNTTTGAVKVNGSEGDSTKVLQSNGAGNPPSWSQPTNAVANNVFTVNSSAPITALNGGATLDIPGLSQAVNVTGTSGKIIIAFDVYAKNNSCFLCHNTDAYIYIWMDNQIISSNIFPIDNGFERQLSGLFLVQTVGGGHAIKLQCNCAGASVTFGCNSCSNAKRMVVEVINN
jgi:hypothetical protein